MIDLAFHGDSFGLDPRWDRARALHAQLRAEFAPIFALAGEIFAKWPSRTIEEKAHDRAQFLTVVEETPEAVRFIWFECPGLPAELRAALEEIL